MRVAVAERIRDRYDLSDLVAESRDHQFWRAYDNRLRRTVGLRIVSGHFPRMRALHDASIAAAHITDRRFANVLDVLGPEPDDQLIIITEWIPGISLAEVLAEPMNPHGAAATTAQVARAIASSHAQGVNHGRLRPRCVTITPDGQVRVRGHGVDEALYGTEPEPDPAAADIHGIGSLLYACLTARWPGGPGTGLPPAPLIEGRPVEVEFLAQVPRSLKSIITACWDGHYADVGAVAADLRAAAEALADRPNTPFWSHRGGRVAVIAAVAATATGIGLMSLATASNRSGEKVTAQPRSVGVATLSSPGNPQGARLPVVDSEDFDPYGVDGEYPDKVPAATDGDPITAWTTLEYFDPYLGGKPGVGIVFDLGVPRPVRSMTLGFVGANSNVEVRMANRRLADPERYRLFAEVSGAGSKITLRSPRAITGRYVLVWFTRLPWIDGGYRGGVRSIVVRS